jgi:hypothetical protein
MLFSARDFSAYHVSRHTGLSSFVRVLPRFVLFLLVQVFPLLVRFFFLSCIQFILLSMCCSISVLLVSLAPKHGVAGTWYHHRAQFITSSSILFLDRYRVKHVLFLSYQIKKLEVF